MPRAVRFDEYGGVELLDVREVEQATPGAVEVVVQVVSTAVNPGEIAIREGALHDQWPAAFPSGQGSDFAGLVHSVGEGVAGWNIGEAVFGWTDGRAAQADFVTVSADHLVAKPAGAPWDQVASLPIAGCTAYGLVQSVAAVAGETVVVSGAAGGVGCAVVQLLRSAGVRVIGVAGSGNDEWLSSVGVEPVNHGDGLRDRLAAAGRIDAAIDTYGGEYVQLAVDLGVAPERVSTCIDFDTAGSVGASTVFGTSYTSQAILAELADRVADDSLRFPIAAVFPLDQVRDAYDLLAQRHTRGKIVLHVNDAPDEAQGGPAH